jgi:hypothetical protein
MDGVVANSANTLYVSWLGLQGSIFRLWRSGSPESGFTVIQNRLTVPFYEDLNVNLYDEADKYYYKVESLDSSGGVSGTSAVMTARYNKPDNVANKVLYEIKVVLRMMRNPPVYLLIRKRTLDHCTECWNPITKRPKFANCLACFGTGNIGGYYAPFPVLMSSDVSQSVSISNGEDSNLVKLTPINAWMSNSPLMNPDDVIVDVMNRRYNIQQVIPRTRSQYVIRQILQLVPLEKGHPAYNVSVNFGGVV